MLQDQSLVEGQTFIARGDLTQLAAHAVGFSTDIWLSPGHMARAFEANIPGFSEWYRRQQDSLVEPVPIGHTAWFPTAVSPPYGVVIVASAGGRPTLEDKAAIAVRAAIDAAVPRLREIRGPEERVLVALPMFRTGLGGDHDFLVRTALAQISEAQRTLRRHPRADVAFVAYTPTLYRIFLEARQELEFPEGRSDLEVPELERALIQGHCVPFVGAGLSRGAGLPDWSELVARLAHELGLDPTETYDPLDLAQWYRERHGPDALASIISGTYSAPVQQARPTLAHYLLLSLPVRLVLTTNYDDLIERALLGLKRYPVRVVSEADVARTALDEGVCVVKLHGDAEAADNIVLCRDDYEEFFDRRPAMSLLLRGLMLNHTFLFLGYSLRDPNFRTMFGEVGRMLREGRRPAFATTFDADSSAGELIREQWRQKNLELISITDGERSVALYRFLDRLGERLALRNPQPILTTDADPAEPCGPCASRS
jgi:hypothetical protein